MSAKPVVYFIDDSATMREVIKIAFRRESLDVVTCHDGASAIDLMENTSPDVVITDVIMPGKDGYEVCQYVKQHPRLGQTPVILMSGVVNKSVADKAFAVQANELIRKPFQPQDLITRVRHLLSAQVEGAPAPQSPESTNAVLSSIFNTPAQAGPGPKPPRSAPMPSMPAIAAAAGAPGVVRPNTPSSSLADTAAAAKQPAEPAPPVSIPGAQITGAAPIPARQAGQGRAQAPSAGGGSAESGRLRLEIFRLHSQIKKLEAELAAEREYSKALEQHLNTLQDSE